MRHTKQRCVWLLCLLLAGAWSFGAEAAKPSDPLVERVAFLKAQVEDLRRTNRLSAEELKRRLLTRYPPGDPRDARWKTRRELLLKASLLVDDLDTRAYNEPRAGAKGYEPPEDVTASHKVYNIDLFNSLLDHQSRRVPARDHNGKTALMYAAEADRFEVLRTLLLFTARKRFEPLYEKPDEDGRSYIDWRDKDGYTALMHAGAAKTENLRAVNYLLNAGADIRPRCDVAQFTALQLAQNAGHEKVAGIIERKMQETPGWLAILESKWGILLGASAPTLALGLWQFWRVCRRRWRETAP